MGKHQLFSELKSLGANFKSAKFIIPDHFSSAEDYNAFLLNLPMKNSNPDPLLLSRYWNNRLVTSTFEFALVKEPDVLENLTSIKTSTSGHDDINISMLLRALPVILPYITHIINTCIGYNTVPHSWKQSILIPIPRNSKPAEYKDLRHISLLPIFSKILEKVMASQLL